MGGVCVTEAAAGLGMDPYDVLVPVNRFALVDLPRRMPVARCGCGWYGCGVTDVTISVDGGVVRWDWHEQVPMSRPATFDRAEYEDEVTRIGADHSWETPGRTVGRLVLGGPAATARPADLELYAVWESEGGVTAVLRHTAEGLHGMDFQIFVDVPFDGRSAVELAAEIDRLVFEVPPHDWSATWHPTQSVDARPPMAGPGWRRRSYG